MFDLQNFYLCIYIIKHTFVCQVFSNICLLFDILKLSIHFSTTRSYIHAPKIFYYIAYTFVNFLNIASNILHSFFVFLYNTFQFLNLLLFYTFELLPLHLEKIRYIFHLKIINLSVRICDGPISINLFCISF